MYHGDDYIGEPAENARYPCETCDPDRGTIAVDDHDGDLAFYVATCDHCGFKIHTDYVNEHPENADWYPFDEVTFDGR